MLGVGNKKEAACNQGVLYSPGRLFLQKCLINFCFAVESDLSLSGHFLYFSHTGTQRYGPAVCTAGFDQ